MHGCACVWQSVEVHDAAQIIIYAQVHAWLCGCVAACEGTRCCAALVTLQECHHSVFSLPPAAITGFARSLLVHACAPCIAAIHL